MIHTLEIYNHSDLQDDGPDDIYTIQMMYRRSKLYPASIKTNEKKIKIPLSSFHLSSKNTSAPKEWNGQL